MAPCCGAAQRPTLQHVLLDCVAESVGRQAMWCSIEAVVGAAEVRRVQALAPAAQVAALVGTAGWGGSAGLVAVRVQRFLADVRAALVRPSQTAAAVLASVADVACQACHSLGREASLLLCDGCGRGCHLRCATPALRQVPDGVWLCRLCAPVGASEQHTSRRPRREGPWPSG